MSVATPRTLYKQLLDAWVSHPSKIGTGLPGGAFTQVVLNRLGPWRRNRAFLARLFSSPSARFLLFSEGKLWSFADHSTHLPVFHSEDILALFDNPFSGDQDTTLETPSSRRPLPVDWILLGAQLNHSTTESSSVDDVLQHPVYWAADITHLTTGKDDNTSRCRRLLDEFMEHYQRKLKSLRSVVFALEKVHQSILAQGVAMVDWNYRHPYCSGCGQPTVSTEAGYKRKCIPKAQEGYTERSVSTPCLNSRGIHNSAYPRTDPVIIVGVVSPDGSRILLGRKSDFPAGWYSCIAGFVEPGETLEAAVRREVAEETGVELGSSTYYASQPWPFPNSLMLGFLGHATTESISLVDNELQGKQLIPGGQNVDDKSIRWYHQRLSFLLRKWQWSDN
ncbi:NADH pyrophosphatase [Dispira parvispora]|uniref:NAD(+) diphosphatase n=1 Tax=Dispira parvispora TaxID=1520584 RepID=A0A9W8AWI3_9FUNG|nr:NADH pyrophosphatase [Dispira parvispora]